MKYSRVFLCSVGLYLLLVALSTIATLIVGSDEATQSMPFIFSLHILGFVTCLILYFYLGYTQITSPYKQASLVAALYWLINLCVSALLYILFEMPIEPLIFLIPVLLHVIAILLGTWFGVRLRHQKELSVNGI